MKAIAGLILASSFLDQFLTMEITHAHFPFGFSFISSGIK